MKLFVVGYPCAIGGAGTELWHTVKLWRSRGHEVVCMYDGPPHDEYVRRCDAVGIESRPMDGFERYDDLRNSVVHGFCCGRFVMSAHKLWDMGCRLVWANCMTFAFDNELKVFRERPPDVAVFQSEFQRAELTAEYDRHRVHPRHAVVTRAAFDAEEYAYCPRAHKQPRQEFFVGRLARPDLDKWPSDMWRSFSRVPHDGLRASVMGVNDRVLQKIGQAPEWAEVLAPNAVTVNRYLSRLHCMFALSGGSRENWPRVGLEAMARGVPVVTHDDWGWREMIRDNETGMLGGETDEMCYRVARLAWDEPLRARIAAAARESLVYDLAAPDKIMANWEAVWSLALQ